MAVYPLEPDRMTTRILDAESAVVVAAEFSAELAEGAAERDLHRVLPADQIDALSASGLLGITVPAAHGGADLCAGTVAEVFRLLAIGDPNVAQIPHSHFVYVNALRHQGNRAQQSFFFEEALAGKRFGNAQSEVGTKHVRDYRNGLVRGGAGAAMVGSHTEVADLIEEYRSVGIEEFVLSGYPHLEESYRFGEGVLPVLAQRGLWEHPAPVAATASVPSGSRAAS